MDKLKDKLGKEMRIELVPEDGHQRIVGQFNTPFVLNVTDAKHILFVAENSIYEATIPTDEVLASTGRIVLKEIGPDLSRISDRPSFQNAVAYGGFLQETPNADATPNPDVTYVGIGKSLLVRTAPGPGFLTRTSYVQAGGQVIRDLVLDPKDWRSVFVVDSNGSVWHSADAGERWVNMSGNLLAFGVTDVRSVEFISGSTGRFLTVGSDHGVYYAPVDAPILWNPLGTGLAHAPVWDMVYNSADDVLVAGTLGRGAWKLSNVSDAFINRTGDIAPVELFDPLGPVSPQFQLLGIDLIDVTDLTATVEMQENPASPGTFMLTYDNQTVGYLALSDAIDGTPFAKTGKLYFAPATSDLAFGDKSSEHGFQGKVQFRYQAGTFEGTTELNIVGGFTTKGENSILENRTALNVMRLQQRLSYLGFRDHNGAVLRVDGTFDVKTESAVSLFKATVQTDGNPDKETSDLDSNTLRWLNSQNAPHWTRLEDPGIPAPGPLPYNYNGGEFDLLPGKDGPNTEVRSGINPQPEPYGTSWLIDTIIAAMADPGVPDTQIITSISTGNGVGSAAYGHSKHRSGMDVDILIPEADRIASPGANLTAGEQKLLNLMLSFKRHAADEAIGSSVAQMLLRNTKVIAAFENATGHQGIAQRETSATEHLYGLHIDLVPPVLNTLGGNVALAMVGGLTAAGDLLAQSQALDLLDTPLPLVGATSDVPGLAPEENRNRKITIGQALIGGDAAPTEDREKDGIGLLLQQAVFSRIAAYFKDSLDPTVSGLEAYLSAVPGVSDVISFNGVDELSFSLTFNADRVEARSLHLGDDAADQRLKLAGESMVDLHSHLTFDLTFGLNLDFSLTPQQAFFIDLRNFTATADVQANDLDLDLRHGLEAVRASNGTLDLHAEVNGAPTGRLTQDQFAVQPLSQLLVLTGTGSADVVLPASATLGDYQTAGQPQISLTSTNVFAGDPAVAFNQDYVNSGLPALSELTPEGLKGTIEQVGGWLDSFRNSPALEEPIPFTKGTTLGDALTYGDSWTEKLTSLLETSPGKPAYQTLQQLTDLLAPSIEGVTYDPATHELLFHVHLADSAAPQSVPIGFPSGMGSLTNIKSSSKVGLAADIDTEFTFGLNLDPIGGGFTLTPATLLASLNGGVGVNNKAGAADLRLTLSDGTTFDVDLDGCATMGDLLNRMNQALPVDMRSKFTAAIEPVHQRALLLTDNSNGEAGPFTVKGLNGSLAGLEGFGLGILGASNSPDAAGQRQIYGAPLHGDTVANHIFLVSSAADRPRIAGAVSMTATDIDASARFGYAGVQIVDGSGTASANVSLNLIDPDTQAGTPNRITLTELYDGLSEIVALVSGSQLTGSADLRLPVQAVLPGAALPGTAAITATWSDIADPSTLTLGATDLDKLLRLEQLTTDDLLAALESVSEYLSSLDQFSFLHDNLPVINRSLGDLLAMQGGLQSLIDAFRAAPANALEDLEESLETALERGLNLPLTAGTDGTTAEISLDNTPGKPALKIQLHLPKSFSDVLPLNVDLASIGLEGIKNLVDVRGTARFAVSAQAVIDLDLGVDLSTPGNPRPFLYDSTHAAVSATINGTGLTFKAAVGPLGVFVGNGSNNNGFVKLDADGAGPSTAPATLSVNLANPDGDGRHYLDQPLAGDLAPAVAGAVNATLPLYFPTVTQALDPSKPNLIVNVADLSDIPGTTSLVVPDFAARFGGIDLSSDLSGLLDGWDGIFTLLETALDQQVFGVKLPLIGDQLQDAAHFIGDLRRRVLDNLDMPGAKTVAFVRQRIFEALGPGGLNWLLDRTGDHQVTADDVGITPSNPNLTTDAIQIDVKLGKSMTPVDIPVGFDIGLPLLGMQVDGNVQLSTGFSIDLGVGISKTKGVYLDTTRTNELSVSIEARLPGLSATGTLGFLQLQVKDRAGDPTVFAGTFGIDLVDPGTGAENDGRLALAEIGSLPSFASVIDAHFSANADVNLDLTAGFGDPDFPSLTTDFHLDWSFNNADTDSPATSFGNAPTIEFGDIRLNPGRAIRKLMGPILDLIEGVLGPVKPVFDTLTDRLPVMSDLLGHDVTLLDLAEASGKITPETRKVVELMARLLDFAEASKHVEDASLVLGSFKPNFGVNGFGQALDIRGVNMSAAIPDVTAGGEAVSGGAADFLHLGDALGTGGNEGPKFPLLENPTSAFKLLLGQDIDLFRWNLSTTFLDFKYHSVMAFPEIIEVAFLTLDGFVKGDMHFDFGYDTRGIRHTIDTGDATHLFDGFFINDLDGAGHDINELNLNASFTAALGVGIGVGFGGLDVHVEAGIEGGLTANIGLDLNDPDKDGKVHLDEIAQTYGEGGIFNVLLPNGRFGGHVAAYVKGVASAGPVDIDLFEVRTEAEGTLYESHAAPQASPPPHATPGFAVMVGTELHLVTTAQNDNFEVLPGGAADSVIVNSMGVRATFSGVTHIFAAASDGDDVITINPRVGIPIELYGGDGNDRLTAGGGPAILHGGANDDYLTGSTKIDYLYGDQGNDQLFGLRGEDFLYGWTGDDLLDGGADDDTLYGDDGDDRLYGGDGVDYIYAGANNDFVTGDLGNDVIYGDGGDDNIDAGPSNDTVYGGDGNDRILGGPGTDSLFGEGDNDTIFAGIGSNPGDLDTLHTIDGGAGDDTIYGDQGQDTIFGRGGSDRIYAFGGTDVIYAGSGDDLVDAGDGSDTVFGGSGADRIDAGSSSDLVYGDRRDGDTSDPDDTGDDGDDFIQLAAGVDTAYAGGGNDTVFGGLGSDNLYGGDGDDHLVAGVTRDGGDAASTHYIDAGEGNDIIYGDFGVDRIIAGPEIAEDDEDNDLVYAYAGNDIIDAGDGDDVVYAGLGSDRVIGGWGRDTIYATDSAGGNGNSADVNTIFGDLEDEYAQLPGEPEAGGEEEEGTAPQEDDAGQSDLIYGDAGDDVIHAGPGDDRVYAYAGIDTITGADGDDLIVAGAGSDTISGGWGKDTIFAGINQAGGGSAGDVNTIDADPRDLDAPGADEDHKDTVYGDIGSDTIYTGPGGDKVYGLAGNDAIDTGTGADFIDAGDGNDTVDSGAHDDIVLGGTGNDVIFAGAGNDRVAAGAGDDWVVGGSGDDDLSGDTGRDVLWGGVEAFGLASFSRDNAAGFNDPMDFAAAEADHATGFTPPHIVPAILAGLSVEGDALDGRDKIRGGGDTDWLFGGGDQDDLDGGDGSDYVDGGSGHDTAVRGGAGDDVVRGGSGNDVLHGDSGIDQLYGEAGVDYLFGDAGTVIGGVHVLAGQRLWGGDGIDKLWGYAPTLDVSVESLLVGDEFHGGGGGDLRQHPP